MWVFYKVDEEIVEDNLYYCLVNFDKKSGTYKYFIVPNNKFTEYLHYEHKYWMGANPKHKESNFRKKY